MADLVDGFGLTANGVSPAERGVGQAQPPRQARARDSSPTTATGESFEQSDQGFAEILVMVLVHERQLWASGQTSETVPIQGTVPRHGQQHSQAKLNSQLPPGGFDMLRNAFRRELRDWENFSEGIILQNFHELRQATLNALIDFIGRTLSTPPGPDAAKMDLVTVVNGAVGFALAELLKRFGVAGSAISSGITTLADIIANHVAEGMARADLAARREHIRRALTNDPNLLTEWMRGIYRVNRIDDYYGHWLQQIPNERLLDFRLPYAPESHAPHEFESLLRRGLSLGLQQPTAAPRLNELALTAWLDHHGLAVDDHRQVRELLLGRPVRTTVLRPYRFLGAVLRPPQKVRTLETVIVQLFPPGVDIFHQAPVGMLAIHEPTAAAFLHRFSDGLYVDPQTPDESRIDQ